MPFQIIRNDITKVKADVIVNTANPEPVIGRGTDSAIYHAAGETELLAERRRIGEIAPGHAAVTPAFGLPARHIIHTVGPAWLDGRHGEREILHSCYRNSLELAAELSAASIAFPLIATGVYGFPRDEALNIALSEIGKFLLTHDMKVILVVFDRRAFELSETLVGEIEAFIDDHGVRAAREEEYGDADAWERPRAFRRRPEREERQTELAAFPDLSSPEASGDLLPGAVALPGAAAPAPLPDMEEKTLDEVLRGAGQSFQQRLFELIDESGMDDVSVYKKANIDRKLFNKIKNQPDYKPGKSTVLAFAIALKLSLKETEEMLKKAGFSLSHSSKFDLIVEFFITHGNYDIFEINEALFSFDQKLLGSVM